jgi:magnesium transporter
MIRTRRVADGRLIAEDAPDRLDPEAVWIDLLHPTPEETARAEALLGIDLPGPEDMAEIEASSRVYMVGEAAVMTLPYILTSPTYPEQEHLTFVLTPRRLVTLRYAEPSSLDAFDAALARFPELCAGPAEAFAGLADAIADRMADKLEETGRELDRIGRAAFAAEARSRDLRELMRRLGREGETAPKIRETLVGLSRVVAFARTAAPVRRNPAAAQKLKTVGRDAAMLIEHADAVTGRVAFLLDAMLGMTGIEQNAIIKIFSVVAVMFLPPTLIASVYGMNFEHMPELSWPFGYPLALLAMAASMAAPYLYFRRRGWI